MPKILKGRHGKAHAEAKPYGMVFYSLPLREGTIPCDDMYKLGQMFMNEAIKSAQLLKKSA